VFGFINLYTYIYIYIYIGIYVCVNIKREEMNLYLKRVVNMCRGMLAKKGMCF